MADKPEDVNPPETEQPKEPCPPAEDGKVKDPTGDESTKNIDC